MFGRSLRVKFREAFRLQKAERWFLRLVEGVPGARTDSILGTVEEDRPLFSGLSLHFRAEEASERVVYQPVGGSRGKSPRAFALHLVALLPPASTATATARVAEAHCQIDLESLSEMARMLWDGRATMTTSGQLRVGHLTFRHTDTKDNHLKKKAIISATACDAKERR